MKQILALLFMLAICWQGIYAKDANTKDSVRYRYIGNDVTVQQGGDTYSLKKGTIVCFSKPVNLTTRKEITVTLVNQNKNSKNKATIVFHKNDVELNTLFEQKPNFDARYIYIGNDTTIEQGNVSVPLKKGSLVLLPKSTDLAKVSEITILVNTEEVKIKSENTELKTLFEPETQGKKDGEDSSVWCFIAWLVGGVVIGSLGTIATIKAIKSHLAKTAGKKKTTVNEVSYKWDGTLELNDGFPHKTYKIQNAKKREKKCSHKYLIQTVRISEPVSQKCIDSVVDKYYQNYTPELRSQIKKFIITKYDKYKEENPKEQVSQLAFPVEYLKTEADGYTWAKEVSVFVRPISVDMIKSSETGETDEHKLLIDDDLATLQTLFEGTEISEQAVGALNSIKGKTTEFNAALNIRLDDLRQSAEDLRTQISTLKVNDAKNEEEIGKLKKERDEALAASKADKQALANTVSLLEKERANTEILNGQINSKDTIIQRLKNESKEYNQLLTFYKPCMDAAKTALAIVDDTANVQTLAGDLYQSYRNEQGMDTFCYYMERILQKYRHSMRCFQGKDEEYNTELRMLASTGLVFKGGWIDKMLANKNSDNEKADVFAIKLYADYMSSFIGFAVVMADEYAYLLKAIVKDVDAATTRNIAQLSDEIRELSRRLGYKINYARPITPISKYDNVENDEYIDTGGKFEKNTIMEVIKMAVNFGTSQSKTKVKTQI